MSEKRTIRAKRSPKHGSSGRRRTECGAMDAEAELAMSGAAMKNAAALKLCNWMPGKGNPRTYGARPRPPVLPTLGFRVLDDKVPRARGKELRRLLLDMHVASLARLCFADVEDLLFGVEPDARRRIAVAVVRYLDGDGRRRPRPKLDVVGKLLRLRPRPPVTFRVRLDYPLCKAVEVTVPPYSNGRSKICTVGYLCWAAAKGYVWAYRRWKQTGVWGHGLNDLVLEGLIIREGGIVEPLVGS